MSMTEWATREVELACQQECGDQKDDFSGYVSACYKSALKAFQSLCEDEHSGMSIGITKSILNRLIEGKPLTAIEDTPDVWRIVGEGPEGRVTYQCNRMSALFKDVYADGTVKYNDVDRFRGIDINTKVSYHNGLVDNLLYEMYPISMPYYPGSTSLVWCEDFLFDSKNGDFDTMAILHTTIGEQRIEINRFFTDTANAQSLRESYTEYGKGWLEITKADYEHLRSNRKEVKAE